MARLLDFFRRRPSAKPVRLNSKKVRWVAYSTELKRLTVWNSAGQKTIYNEVSEGVYEKLLTADPPDFFYDNYIAEMTPPKLASVRWLVLAVLLLLAGSLILLERFM